MRTHRFLWLVAVTLLSGIAAQADIIVREDGHAFEGKVLELGDQEAAVIPDHGDTTAVEHMTRTVVARVLTTDAHGARLTDSAAPTTANATQAAGPVDPAAPPIAPAKDEPTYYLIPLHGEVGETVLAGALEKSLADAVQRKPKVVVLDIDSPGGLVEEAKQIVTVLHKYNKKLRIVALVNQDLSAAAIATLSVREIYVKSSSTIGAATSYTPGNLILPPKLEEKMQSVWRATARNSAEEGGHEPMLADAMIDNDQELHWESVGGKPVIKDGPGDHMICRKGKVLTLSSHEAVACGLAKGQADDLEELATALQLAKWTEVKGLGTLLAESLVQRAATYKAEMDKCRARFVQDLTAAEKADPSHAVTTVTRVYSPPTSPLGPQVPPGPRYPRVPGAPGVPSGPFVPGRPGIPMPPQQIVTETQSPSPFVWKRNSLDCVVALQQAEGDIKEAAALATAYGHACEGEMLQELLGKLAIIRAGVFDERDKYVREMFPGGSLKTGEIGGTEGNGFVTTNRNGLAVLGFSYALAGPPGKQILANFEPLCAGPAAGAPANPNTVFAKEGYIVGGLVVQGTATHVTAVQVIFVGYKNGGTIASDTYRSDWIGKPEEGKGKTLAGHGEIVLGTCGKKDGTLVSLGLVTKAPENKK